MSSSVCTFSYCCILKLCEALLLSIAAPLMCPDIGLCYALYVRHVLYPVVYHTDELLQFVFFAFQVISESWQARLCACVLHLFVQKIIPHIMWYDLCIVMCAPTVFNSVCYSESERKEEAKERLEKRLEKRENT